MPPPDKSLISRIDERLAALRRNDREVSIAASGKPDMIRDIRRGRQPGSDRIAKLADALETSPDYLLARTDIPETNARILDERVPIVRHLPQDLPVYGTGLGADLEFFRLDGDGDVPVAIEQTTIDMAEATNFMRRPPALANNRDAYAIITMGESMKPRFRDGESLLVDPRRQPSIGDDVVIQLRAPDEMDADRITGEDRIVAVLIKTLVRRTASFLELEQYNPPVIFRIPTTKIARVHRITAWSEVMSI